MSVDTKMILLGAPSPEEIAAVIRNEFAVEVKVEATLYDEMFRLQFPDPAGRQPGDAKYRQLSVFPDVQSSSYRDIYDGKHTLGTLGAFGSSVAIANALAARFGGYVLDNDTLDDWRFIEPRTDVAVNLTPEDKLKIELSQILGYKDAAVVAAIVDQPEKLEQVMAAYSTYVEAKNEAAGTPTP